MSSKRENDNSLCLKPRNIKGILQFHGIHSQNGIGILFRFIPLDRIISRDFKVIVNGNYSLNPFCLHK